MKALLSSNRTNPQITTAAPRGQINAPWMGEWDWGLGAVVGGGSGGGRT